MKRLGIDLLKVGLNDPYRADEALKEAALEITLQEIATSENSRKLVKLFALDRAQANELSRLHAVIQVLSGMLIDANVISGDDLELRLKDAFRVLEEASRPTEAKASEPVTTCTRCGEKVYARNTQITEDGTVCDSCYY